MEKKQLAGALCLLMAAAATAALAHPDSRLRGELVMSQPPPKAQEELRAYFNQHYQEATCSAVRLWAHSRVGWRTGSVRKHTAAAMQATTAASTSQKAGLR